MIPKITIVSLRSSLFKLPTLRIDRATFLGNPFIIGKDGTREEVVEKYKQHFDQLMINDKEFKDSFYETARSYAHYEKIQLACWCAPLLCHGSVIKQALDEYYRNINDS